MKALSTTTRSKLTTHYLRTFGTTSNNNKSSSTSKQQQQEQQQGQRKSHLAQTMVGGVHGNWSTMTDKSWRNKPLFRRQGDVRFRTGTEAADLLVKEAIRRDGHEVEFLNSIESTMGTLSSVFDRNPRYAFLAKQMMEPERFIQFRVPWMDDTGVYRLSRGWRVQYNSALGPYEGPIHFGHHVSSGVIKALGFDTILSNSLTGNHVGAAVGGADVNPFNKTEAEIQRFCQSYVTELSKYIGPDVDTPTMGMGVGGLEMGYMLGQYKRINSQGTSGGRPFILGAEANVSKVTGFGVVHFANEMLKAKGQNLAGKRCLISGAGKVARAVAEKLLEFGAIPLTFSDAGGYVYEPDGFDASHLRNINAIKEDRGATVGRYVISSATAKFNEEETLFDIPCDLCFPCASINEISVDVLNKLVDNGCKGIIEGGHSAVSHDARKLMRQRGVQYGPHTMTLTGTTIFNGIGYNKFDAVADAALAARISHIYDEVARTAKEFNTRGDLFAGANILGFIRVADVMITQGTV